MARAPSVASVPNSLVVGCGRCAVGSSRDVVCVLILFSSLSLSLSCLELASFSLPCAAELFMYQGFRKKVRRFAGRRDNSQARKDLLSSEGRGFEAARRDL